MITDAQGPCEVRRGKTRQGCELFKNLLVGDEIAVARGGTLAITYYQPAREFTLTGESRFAIAAGELRPLAGTAAARRDLAGVDGARLHDWGREREVMGGLVVRGGGRHKVRLLSPLGTVLERPATFSWDVPAAEPPRPDAQFRFILQDDVGHVVLQTLVGKTSFHLPPETPLTEGAEYVWQVSMLLANGDSFVSSGDFTIADAELRQKAAAMRPPAGAPFSQRLVHAIALDTLRLHETARSYWRTLAAERPAVAELRKLARDAPVNRPDP